MTKTTYASMKLKVNTQPKEIDFEGNKINILQYLPIENKYDLVMITLQKSLEEGIKAENTNIESRNAEINEKQLMLDEKIVEGKALREELDKLDIEINEFKSGLNELENVIKRAKASVVIYSTNKKENIKKVENNLPFVKPFFQFFKNKRYLVL